MQANENWSCESSSRSSLMCRIGRTWRSAPISSSIPGKGRSDQHPCLQCFAAYQRGKDAHVATICVLASVFSCSRDRFLDGSILHEHLLLDRYSWTLGVYAGERYYMCFGCNTIPSLLRDLLTKIEEFGLPSLLDDDGSPYFCLDKCV